MEECWAQLGAKLGIGSFWGANKKMETDGEPVLHNSGEVFAAFEQNYQLCLTVAAPSTGEAQSHSLL